MSTISHTRYREVVIGIAFAVVMFAGWLYLVSVVRMESTAIKARALSLATTEQSISDVKEVYAYTDNNAELFKRIDYRFVDAQSVVRFIEALEAVSNDSRAALSFGGVSMASGGGKPSFSVALDGTFPALYQYLTLLEHIPYDITITSIRFANRKTGVWHADVQVVLDSYTG